MRFLLSALLLLQSAPPSGSINGTVILAGSQSESPLTMARVELSGGPQLPLVARTDGEGRFAFANLPSGSYRLRVTKDGFLRQEYAKRAAIVIKPDSPHKSVVFALELAPTMAGRIASDTGEPIANILVQALKANYGPHGERTFTALASTLSDDLGKYRLYWLDPGDYIVSASFVPAVKTPGNPIETIPQAVYAPTYYPNASDLGNAQRISLKADQNALTLDFRLVRSPAVTVRGTIEIAGKGRGPAIPVTLTLTGDTTGAARYAGKSNDLGNFEIKNVAPGSYIASATGVIENAIYTAAKHIDVHNRDESNVGLMLSVGVQVQGRLALDTNVPANMSGARITLIPLDPYLESFADLNAQADGQFAVRGVQPGAYSIEIPGVPQDLYIKMERSGQTNLLTAPLNVAWDSPPALEIILGTDGGRVSGSVTDREGKAFAGAQVVLAPNADRRDRVDLYRVAGSDEDGKFELRGIPPGVYQLFAWENIEERAWLNSDFMGKYVNLGTAVTIAANSGGTIQVTVITN